VHLYESSVVGLGRVTYPLLVRLIKAVVRVQVVVALWFVAVALMQVVVRVVVRVVVERVVAGAVVAVDVGAEASASFVAAGDVGAEACAGVCRG
jgi:hypothetical protein